MTSNPRDNRRFMSMLAVAAIGLLSAGSIAGMKLGLAWLGCARTACQVGSPSGVSHAWQSHP